MTADFATQIAEKQSAKEALTAEIASITANIDTLKADWKEKKTALKKARADAKAAEETKKAEAESVLKKLLAGPLRKFCVSDIRQNQEYHIIHVHDGGFFPLSTAFPGG